MLALLTLFVLLGALRMPCSSTCSRRPCRAGCCRERHGAQGVEIDGPPGKRFDEILTADALEFVAPLQRAFDATRRVEITGPTSRKMVINALNSGATGFMADSEDSNSPTWSNMIGGPMNPADAICGRIEHAEKGNGLVRELETSELEKIRLQIGDDEWFEDEGRPGLSRELFDACLARCMQCVGAT